MNKIEIIAEIGKNFVITEQQEPLQVLLERAKTLILEAKKAGATVAKFQVHSDDEVHPDAKLISPHFNQDRYEWVKRNIYPMSFWLVLRGYCRAVGIEFLATPMSRGAAVLLDEIGVDRWKIGSGDILDFVLLDYVRDSGKPVILSSGMSSLEELKLAYDYLAEKVQDITILHCVSIYPCPLEKLNLHTISFLKKEFPKARIGFSDHSLEVSTAAFAVSMGAEVIEKHFTLNRNSWGPDHKVSLLPHEFKQMVQEVEMDVPEIPKVALGVATKYIQEDEQKFRKVFRKGLYASRDIKKNEILDQDCIISLRPKIDGAFPSESYPSLLNKFTPRDYKKYEAIL